MNDNIPTELITKATASLEEQVKKELEQEDPTAEKAKAILQNNEATAGNDRATGT